MFAEHVIGFALRHARHLRKARGFKPLARLLVLARSRAGGGSLKRWLQLNSEKRQDLTDQFLSAYSLTTELAYITGKTCTCPPVGDRGLLNARLVERGLIRAAVRRARSNIWV